MMINWMRGEWNSRDKKQRFGEIILPFVFVAALAGVIYMGTVVN